MSESADGKEGAGEVLKNTGAFPFFCLQNGTLKKKKTPNFTKKKKINKKCAYKRMLQHTIRKGCDISAIS